MLDFLSFILWERKGIGLLGQGTGQKVYASRAGQGKTLNPVWKVYRQAVTAARRVRSG
jgi:hypothetical protein